MIESLLYLPIEGHPTCSSRQQRGAVSTQIADNVLAKVAKGMKTINKINMTFIVHNTNNKR